MIMQFIYNYLSNYIPRHSSTQENGNEPHKVDINHVNILPWKKIIS